MIVLIPKKDNPKLVKDYRPISLLGGIYKIVAKILASRIKLLLPKLVHHSQSGFVHGRRLADNCLSIWARIEEGPKLGKHVLLKVDFEKAYDRLEWRFIHKCLEIMNFGPNFRRWVGGLLENASVILHVNGASSEHIRITRSVRQGCPLAPLLFVLATEPLLRGLANLQDRGAIQGIKMLV